MNFLDQENKAAELTKLVATVLDTNLLLDDSELQKELKMLRPLLMPYHVDTTMDELHASLPQFRGNKTLKLFKVVNNFATGLQVLADSSKALEARTKDEHLRTRLEKVYSDAGEVPVTVEGDEGIQAELKFKLVFKELTDIRANCSEMLADQKADEINFVEKRVEDLPGEERCDRVAPGRVDPLFGRQREGREPERERERETDREWGWLQNCIV